MLSTLFMLITLIIFVLYGVLASVVREHISNSPRLIVWLRKSFAAMLAALGVKLGMTDQ